jgi:hypothetical protein
MILLFYLKLQINLLWRSISVCTKRPASHLKDFMFKSRSWDRLFSTNLGI